MWPAWFGACLCRMTSFSSTHRQEWCSPHFQCARADFADLDALHAYVHLSYPAPFLIRHTGEPALCLRSEHIAKRLMHIMEEVGIDKSIFRPTASRGASATHLLKN